MLTQFPTVGGTLWGGFIYDATKWETDTGLLMDALANDVKFGGTRDTTIAAKAYWIGTQTQLPECTTTKGCGVYTNENNFDGLHFR